MSAEFGAIVADRRTGESYGIAPGWQPIFGPSEHGLMLFQSTRGGSFGLTLAVVALGADPTGAAVQFDTPSPLSPRVESTAVSPAGDRAVVVGTLGDPVGTQGFVIDLDNRDVISFTTPLALSHVTPLEDGFVLAGVQGGKDEPASVHVERYSWSGQLERSTAFPAGVIENSIVRTSPDGRWLAWREVLLLGTGFGAGGVEHWPVIVIGEIETGEVRFRAVRASLHTGAALLHWLPDSSAILIGEPDGFALLTTSGEVRQLPLSPVGHFDPWPIPAPHDASLLVYDGRVINLDGNASSVEVGAGAWAGSTFLMGNSSLNAAGTELRLARSVLGGRDFGPGGLSTLGLPLRIERPPFADIVRLRVDADGDRLNVRALPGVSSQLVGRLDDGAEVIVTNGDGRDMCGDLGCSVENDPDLPYNEGWWIHVRAADGLEGWVASEFLVWADE